MPAVAGIAVEETGEAVAVVCRAEGLAVIDGHSVLSG